jgi:hypothetical protein
MKKPSKLEEFAQKQKVKVWTQSEFKVIQKVIDENNGRWGSCVLAKFIVQEGLLPNRTAESIGNKIRWMMGRT